MVCLRFRFPAFYRFAAILALLAMLAPLGTALVHHPAAQSFMRICGMGHPADNSQNQAPTHKLPFCPICQHLHLLSGGFVSPHNPVLVDVFSFVIIVITCAEPYFLKLAHAPQARPRAPPSLV